MSLGQDPRWRHAVVKSVAPRGEDRMLDVATGTALIAAELVKRGAGSVVGLDQSAEMLVTACRRQARVPGLAQRLELVQGEAEHLPFADASFDGVTFAYLLRYVDDLRATIFELTRVLAAGGRIAGFEFGLPPRGPLRAGWTVYTKLAMPVVGRIFSRDWAAAGSFLGPSITEFYDRHPLEQVVGYFRQAGLVDVGVRRMSFGAGLVISGRKAREDAR
jgi:demethylmenaquinone methyltransferase/2-methoxy-6-polyprenyl-1,4-benzoquinol methylase